MNLNLLNSSCGLSLVGQQHELKKSYFNFSSRSFVNYSLLEL